jgi:hypothetical protein
MKRQSKNKPKKPRVRINYRELYFQEKEKLNGKIFSLEDQIRKLNKDLSCVREENYNLNTWLHDGSDETILKELVDCLTDEQKDAADWMKCRREVYAVELLKLFQEWKNTKRLTEESPAYFRK